ncbi:uncharacterized protein LOC121369905 [Gigantopelta aegis]|uniref:uncharacterized protein LOC121369905 n=1 Tax=Gigantopelta aegis TaxID=1735272 RepID=UPI001B888D92|nr:uncharacterized protein LOC121369905 [Gigantopelta aegis]
MANAKNGQRLSILITITISLCLVFITEGHWAKKSKKYNRTKYYVTLAEQPPAPSNHSSSVSMNLAINVAGIFPNLTATADSEATRSESGIGALMPWADRLYMVSYLSVPNAGNGTGLYEIDSSMTMKKIASHRSTYANRIIHRQSNRIVIGPYTVDTQRRVGVFQDLLQVRVAATAEHLNEPETKVYMLGMDGPLWECDVYNLTCKQLFDLVQVLDINTTAGEQPHFKAAHTMNGRLVVTSNTFEEADFTGSQHGGRLAEWEGPGHNWTILERTAFVEVTGRRNFGKVIYAVGWDYRSVILKVFVGDTRQDRKWQTYRLPKASHAYDHLWQTEWPRIREVETERYLMDAHGMFYELSPLGWAGSTWGLRPVCQHLRMIPDYTSFRGMLVLGGNQVSSIMDNNVVTGQAQSGLWFGKTDDLWSFGKPQGWGAVWRRDLVDVGTLSDPYLMTGFDKKVLFITVHDGGYQCSFFIQVDVTGAADHLAMEHWITIKTITFSSSSAIHEQSAFYVFPEGFSAHWVRLESPEYAGTVTAYFHYT